MTMFYDANLVVMTRKWLQEFTQLFS